jgi:hypothetical protein
MTVPLKTGLSIAIAVLVTASVGWRFSHAQPEPEPAPAPAASSGAGGASSMPFRAGDQIELFLAGREGNDVVHLTGTITQIAPDALHLRQAITQEVAKPGGEAEQRQVQVERWVPLRSVLYLEKEAK